jgi:Fe-S oxidoreductase
MRVDPGIRERLIRRSSGTLGLCYQCGTCTAICPLAGDSSVNYIRKLVKYAQYGIIPSEEDLVRIVWSCTTCGICASSCPRGVDIPGVIRVFREILSEKKRDQRFSEVLWRLYESGNPWGYGSGEIRKFRISFRDLQISSGSKPDYVIYPCCFTTIDPLSQKILRSVIKIFRAAGFNIGVVDSMCCGDVAYQSGEIYFLEEYIGRLRELLEKIEAPLVVLSPHTLYMFRKIYPDLGFKMPVEVYHHTEVLSELLSKGKIRVREPENIHIVSYHDPCYLARYLRIHEEPRNIIENRPRIRFIEMEHTRENTLCCGAGGGMIFARESSVRIAVNRIREAEAVGAEVLATACQFCMRMFVDELKIRKSSISSVADVSELISSNMV